MKWIDFNMSSINILDFLWVVEPYSWKEEMISRKEMVLEFKGRRDTATKNTKKKKSQKHAPIKKQFLGVTAVVLLVLQIKTFLCTLWTEFEKISL